MRGFLFVALLASPAFAQDDYDLANALADRGWFDLADQLYVAIENNSALTPEQRAEGKYGRLQMKILETKREADPQAKEKRFDELIAEMQKFLDAFRNHPRRAEALSDLGKLRQEKGKLLLQKGKTDPAALDLAEKEFDAAEKLFDDQISELQKVALSLPAEGDKDYKKKFAEYEVWEEKMMFAKYYKGMAMYARGEAYRGNPAKYGEMKKKLTEMITFFYEKFMWEYEGYYLASDVFLTMGLACQILAETSGRAEAEKYWTQCLVSPGYIAKPRGLLDNPEDRKNEDVRELATRGTYFEMKARLSYGDTKKGGAAAREYALAAKLAEDIFRYYPSARKETLGKAILLEQGKALCKVGELKKGRNLLHQLKESEKGTWIENAAFDILGEFAADDDLKLAVDSADNILDRDEFYRALQKYRRALGVIRTDDERKKWLPHCWFKVATCYMSLNRYHEAATACGVVAFPNSPFLNEDSAQKAALLKLDALRRIAARTKDPADQKALAEYNNWVTAQPQFRDLVGEEPIYNAGVGYERSKEWLKAAAEWQKIVARKNSKYYEEALHSVGYDYYRQAKTILEELDKTEKITEADRKKRTQEAVGFFDQALKAFLEHRTYVDKLPSKDAKMVDRAIVSIRLGCEIYVHPAKGSPLEALKLSEGLEQKYPKADPKRIVGLMTVRIDAKLKLDDQEMWYCATCKAPVRSDKPDACPQCKKGPLGSFIEQAEEDMQVLKAKYEKEGLGRDHYLRALGLIAQKLEKKAFDLRSADPPRAKEFVVRAANYYYVYFQTNPEPPKGEQLEAMAEKLFFAAEERLERVEKLADAKARDQAATEAKDLFQKAKDLFEQYLAISEASLASKSPEKLKILKRRITRASAQSGHFDVAIRSLEEVLKNDKLTETRDGSAWEDLANCYLAKAESMGSSAERDKLFKQADDIYATLASALREGNRIDEHFFRLMFQHARILHKMDLTRLKYLFDQLDSKGYGRGFGCDRCHRVMTPLDLKGGKTCLYDRCGVCRASYKRGTAPTCVGCKSPVAACDNASLIEVGWDDRLQHECVPLLRCGNWRCGNLVREYRFRCTNGACGFERTADRAVPVEYDCTKCAAKGSLKPATFRNYLCGTCGCDFETETPGGASLDCAPHVRCEKCKKGFPKGETCPAPGCGGKLAPDACGGKGTLQPLCSRCESSPDSRRSRCGNCEDLVWPRQFKDKKTCRKPGCGGALVEAREVLTLAGCGEKYRASEVEERHRLRCTACDTPWGVTRELEQSGVCDGKDCPADRKGRLRDVILCKNPACKAVDTIFPIGRWTREDWDRGKYRDKFEEIRTDLLERLPEKKPGGGR